MNVRVTGQATYTFADLLSASFWGRSRAFRMSYLGVLALAVAYTLWIDGVEDFDDLLESSLVPAILLVLAVIAYLAVHWFIFWRMNADQRRIVYEVDDTQLEFSDAAGASTVLPWGRLKGCREHGSGIALFLKPMGSGWLIRRGFAPAEWQAFRDLARSMLGRTARLRDKK